MINPRKDRTAPEDFSGVKCRWIDCAHGLGLAGRGVCSADGPWWRKNCPNYENNDEYVKSMKESP